MVGLVSHVRFLKFSIFASGTHGAVGSVLRNITYGLVLRTSKGFPLCQTSLQGTNTKETLWITDCRTILCITVESARSSLVVLTKHAACVAYQFRRLVAKNKYVSLCVISA
jgi:hypothetical protein